MLHMSFQVAAHQTEGYLVQTNVYAGPLDLLLDLIERAELDITTLALAQVTDQYLAYLKHIEDRDPEEVSAFLIIAARLLQIKSSALLPRPTVNLEGPAEEDPGEALAQQLIQYRRFKQISDWLSQREESSLHTYLRLAPPPIKVEPKLDLSDLTLEELVSTAADIFFAEPDAVNLSEVVNMPRVTIREKIHTILETAKLMSSPSFRSILSGWNRVEVVVTFLALLELIKRHIIEANQDNLFGDIHFQSRQEWSEDELIEIDFDE